MAKVSEQWQKLTREEFVEINDDFLNVFRAAGATNKFVAWDPFEPSSRYFKFLLLNTALRQSDAFFDGYRRIQHRELGNPITVRCGGCDVDADYLAAVEEWEFLHRAGALTSVRTVVEIGAGFGRTAHTLLTLAPSIERYVIIDLPPMLRLSSAYLARVAPNARIEFISNEDAGAIDSVRPDLAINIDSFQEMPPDVIAEYMTRVIVRAPQFYTKNPIGKYTPTSIGRPQLAPDQLMDVLELGRCRDVIDIFDDGVLTSAREKFLEAYRPSPEYRLSGSKPMDLFPYFVHALYAR